MIFASNMVLAAPSELPVAICRMTSGISIAVGQAFTHASIISFRTDNARLRHAHRCCRKLGRSRRSFPDIPQGSGALQQYPAFSPWSTQSIFDHLIKPTDDCQCCAEMRLLRSTAPIRSSAISVAQRAEDRENPTFRGQPLDGEEWDRQQSREKKSGTVMRAAWASAGRPQFGK